MFNWIKYINTHYADIPEGLKLAMENYCNSSKYDQDIDYCGSFTEPIDEFYNDNYLDYEVE